MSASAKHLDIRREGVKVANEEKQIIQFMPVFRIVLLFQALFDLSICPFFSP